MTNASQGYLIVGDADSRELSRLLFLVPAYYATEIRRRARLARLRPLAQGEQEIGPVELGANLELTLTNWPFERTAWIVQRFTETDISQEETLSPRTLDSFYEGQHPTLDCLLPCRLGNLKDVRLPKGFLRRYFPQMS